MTHLIRSDSFARFFAITVCSLLLAAVVSAQTTAARPDRGTMPNGTYSVSDIENINLQNGNVSLSIPLAALPPIAGGKLSWALTAHYNSKIWDVTRTQAIGEAFDLSNHYYEIDSIQQSDRGGWRISGQYAIEIRDAHLDFDYELPPVADQDYSLMNEYLWYKVVLIMPDGAEHELRPLDYSPFPGTKDFLYGYYNPTPFTHGTMRYYSFDGSYLNATINTNGSSWTVYLPDGTKVVQTTDGIQRVQDTNGNKIKIFTDGNGTHYQDEQTLREIRYVMTESEGHPQGQVWYQTVGGIDKHIDINFGVTTVHGQAYKVNDWKPGQVNPSPCVKNLLLSTEIQVVTSIVLPQTEPAPVEPRRFTFTYNSDSEESATNNLRFTCDTSPQPYTRQASKGWGSLNHMETPSGAEIDYSYSLGSGSSFAHLPLMTDEIAGETVTKKTILQDGPDDIWTYEIGSDYAVQTYSGDNSSVREDKYPQGSSMGTGFGGAYFGASGLVYRITRPFTKTERHWTNLVFSGASINSPGGTVNFNGVVDAEYTTLTDANGNALKMSAKTFQHDYNGNVLQTTEYDWFDPALVSRDGSGVPTGVPGGATVLRVVNNSYYNPATSSTSGNVYAKRSLTTGTPPILGALQQTTVGPAISQFSYDGQAYGAAPTLGNLTSQSVWDDLDSKWITSSQTYGLYGNLATKTDPRGKVTQFFYDDATHALPNRVVVDPQNGTGTQTSTTAFDYYTGLVTRIIDTNGNFSDIDYTNQLLGTVDPFGRPGLVIGPLVNVDGVDQHHRTKTLYADNSRTVTVMSDLNSEGDGLLKSQTIADMLGRPIESRQFENANDFIAVRKTYDTQNRLSRTSNPFRAGETVVWTTAVTDVLGRMISLTTPDDSVVSTTYDANTVTVTDQNLKVRKSVSDALGRLTQVEEDPIVGGLNYQTNYSYDVSGNLTGVGQGSQTRTFTYDSLSRLRTAINPESGTISYSYDDNGNLLTKADARGVVSTYVYDALNRATSRSYSDGTPAVTYSYDSSAISNGIGRLASVSSSVSTYSYSNYDAMGKALGGTQTLGSQTYTLSYSYDLSGHVKTMTYPSGHTVSYAYDQAGRTNSFTGNLGDGVQRTYANEIIYSAFGGMAKEKFGTDTPLYNKLWYNSRGQLSEIRVSTTYGGSWDTSWNRGAIINHYSNQCWGMCAGQSMTDNNGNVKKQEHEIPDNDQVSTWQACLQTYSYDSLNRLQSVNETKWVNGNGTQTINQVFDYDRYGNRTINQAQTWGGINNKPFTVDSNNNRLGVPGGQSGAMSYDPAGNLTTDTYSGSGVTRAYDAENRMTSETQASNFIAGAYTYNADGQRVRRKVGSVETWQVYGFDGELLAEYAANAAPGSAQKEYGYRNGQLLITAAVPAATSATFIQTDTTTQGNWKGAYGSDGYNVINDAVSYPSYAQVSVSGQNPYTWAASTTDARALRKAASTTDRLAACWYSESNFIVDVNLTDGNVHRVAVYSLDWDGNNVRQERIEILDAATNAVLDSRDVTSYSGGKYTVWDLKGHIKIKVTHLAPSGPNAVMSGLFFGPAQQNVSWTNTVGVSAVGNNLTKTAADGWGNPGGASSTQSIASGDGYVEFTTTQTGTYRMIGLSKGDVNQSYEEIDFAVYYAGNALQIYQNGVFTADVGTYTTGDTLRVAVEGGVVKYRKNGTLLYTSTVAPSYPLLVDTAFYSNGATINNVVISSGSGGSSGGADINWLVADQLGTPRMVFDQTGSVATMKRHDYLPFGEELFAGQGARTTQQGYVADSVRQKFTQKERDNETGLDYFGARYYGSTQGRFTSADDVLNDSRASDPQSWNLYNYVRNNPLRYVDADGRVKRDENGNIIFDVTQTNVTRTYFNSPGERTAPNGQTTAITLTITGQVDTGHIYADDGTAIEAERSLGPLTATITEGGNTVYQGGVDGLPTINGESYAGFNNVSDCHGTSFADGRFWVNDNQVGALMRGDGYDVANPTVRPFSGAIGIYSTDGSLSADAVRHSVTVTKVDATGGVTEVGSKAGITTFQLVAPGPGPGTAWESSNVRLNYYRLKPPTPSEKLKAFVKKQRIY